MTRILRLGAVAMAIAACAGCSTVRSPDARDPWEGLNRATFEFNDGFDKALLRPVAEGYRFVLPSFARNAVSNFFSNLNDPWVALNQLMQGKVERAIDDLGRFVWNSTFGLLGLIDVATDMGLPKHKEDFGQTLAVWGVDFGPYLVIPILGPSSVRDGAGLVADAFAYLPWQIPKWADFDHRVTWQWSLTGLDLVQTRASLLDATDLLEEAALDRYAFLRNAYFQRRRSLIYDGNPPPLPADKQSSAAPRGDPIPTVPLVDAAPPESVPAVPLVDAPPPESVPAVPLVDAAPPGAAPAGPSVEPRLPANYPAVLAADAPRVVAAQLQLSAPAVIRDTE
jgi:phospholipid-binding lipoprotein MlaA